MDTGADAHDVRRSRREIIAADTAVRESGHDRALVRGHRDGSRVSAPVASVKPSSPVPAFRIRRVPSSQPTTARLPDGERAKARARAGGGKISSLGQAPSTFSYSRIVRSVAHRTLRRLPDRATATGWPTSMATARRIILGATPVPHVRTVPSAATVAAHDASGAMIAAVICTEVVIVMQYRRP